MLLKYRRETFFVCVFALDRNEQLIELTWYKV